MKKSDFVAVGILTGIILSLIIFTDRFILLTKSHPLAMGFFKVSILATFGECLKTRLKTGEWKIPRPVQKFIVWGFYGIWFTMIFSLFRIGVPGMIAEGLWFSGADAFSKSLWVNGVFAYGMMLIHEAINQTIEKQKIVTAKEFKEKLDADIWFSAKWYSIPMTIIWFWLPMHTVTFSLEPHYQVLCAAFLSVALGFILTVKK